MFRLPNITMFIMKLIQTSKVVLRFALSDICNPKHTAEIN